MAGDALCVQALPDIYFSMNDATLAIQFQTMKKLILCLGLLLPLILLANDEQTVDEPESIIGGPSGVTS